jgi:deoxyribonuclease-4
MMFIGAHMGSPISTVPRRTVEIGGNTFQIFSHSPRIWKISVNEREREKFRSEMLKWKINPEKTMIHASYLINLASPKEDVWEKSKALMKEEMRIANILGLKYVNVHPGSKLDKPQEWGLQRCAQAVEEIIDESPKDVTLLLEIVAPKGGNIGYNFEQLEKIKKLANRNIKFTYDTCHGFDGGYDITTKKGMEKLIAEIKDTIGMENLVMCHLNDSKYPLGSAKDRHERIGRGYIGKEGFLNFFSFEEVQSIPMILETPGNDEEHAEDISVVKEIWSQLGIL